MDDFGLSSESDEVLDFRQAIRDADQAMEENDWEEAYLSLADAWDILCEDKPDHKAHEAFWLVLSWANAAFMSQEFDDCLEKLSEALKIFRDHELVIGNPFFHLRVGQCLFELAESDSERTDATGQVVDNLARALICGGIEIFENEDTKYLELVLAVVEAPDGFSSWHQARGQGACLGMLDQSAGFLRSHFEKKYGKQIPFGG